MPKVVQKSSAENRKKPRQMQYAQIDNNSDGDGMDDEEAGKTSENQGKNAKITIKESTSSGVESIESGKYSFKSQKNGWAFEQGLCRLVVRTLDCGSRNPGSNPGAVTFLLKIIYQQMN